MHCRMPRIASHFDIQHYPLRSRLAASRIQSEKSCATGLSVRFFKVISASGLTVVGNSIGKARSSWLLGGNCITTRGTIDKNGPVASKVVRSGKVEWTTVGGTLSPCARNASNTTAPYGESGGDRAQGSLI